MVPLATEVLYPTGAYLLDNGRVFVLWLGREVSPNFMHEVRALRLQTSRPTSHAGPRPDCFGILPMQVFGIDPKTNRPTDAEGSALSVEPARPGSLSQRINSVLRSLRTGRPNYQKCFAVRQGEAHHSCADCHWDQRAALSHKGNCRHYTGAARPALLCGGPVSRPVLIHGLYDYRPQAGAYKVIDQGVGLQHSSVLAA